MLPITAHKIYQRAIVSLEYATKPLYSAKCAAVAGRKPVDCDCSRHQRKTAKVKTTTQWRVLAAWMTIGQPKVSSFAPYSGDISSCRALVRLCAGPHTRAYVDWDAISGNSARIGRLHGPTTSHESVIFLLEVLSCTKAG